MILTGSKSVVIPSTKKTYGTVMTANGKIVHINGKESVGVPTIRRLEGKQPFEERQRRMSSNLMAGDAAKKKVEWLSLRRQSMKEVITVTIHGCPGCCRPAARST